MQHYDPKAPLDWYLWVSGLVLLSFALLVAPDAIGELARDPSKIVKALFFRPIEQKQGSEISAGGKLQIPAAAAKEPRLRAFLATIAWAEGTYHSEGWKTIYTNAKFEGFDRHPRQIKCGSIRGKRTCSDAAGAFQFLSTTWGQVAKAKNLPDFSPESQTKGAIELIKRSDALEDVLAGEFNNAACKVGKQWASFPCNGYGQNPKTTRQLRQFYEQRLRCEQEKSCDD
jgi:muramidase (phage lysozyme)